MSPYNLTSSDELADSAVRLNIPSVKQHCLSAGLYAWFGPYDLTSLGTISISQSFHLKPQAALSRLSSKPQSLCLIRQVKTNCGL